jgi:hypothetical protein
MGCRLVISRIRAFGAFWYDFVVGDDWVVAAGVVLTLTLTAVLSHHSTAALWWLVPAAVLLLLPLSLIRAVRRHDRAAGEHTD